LTLAEESFNDSVSFQEVEVSEAGFEEFKGRGEDIFRTHVRAKKLGTCCLSKLCNGNALLEKQISKLAKPVGDDNPLIFHQVNIFV
jgi:hypothetical protein